jgi:hypothetical protein
MMTSSTGIPSVTPSTPTWDHRSTSQPSDGREIVAVYPNIRLIISSCEMECLF